jgi:hypothetical protein
MHGMLSLGILVAALAGLAGWAGYLIVRLYRACPAPRSAPAQPAADDAVAPDMVAPDTAAPDTAARDTVAPGRADESAELSAADDPTQPIPMDDPPQRPATTPQPVA